MNKTRATQAFALLLAHGIALMATASGQEAHATDRNAARSGPVKTALLLEIMADKQTYLVGESVSVRVTLRNTSATPIWVDLSRAHFIDPCSEEPLVFLPNLGNRPSGDGASLGTCLLVPANGEASVVVPDMFFPVGFPTSTCLEYKYAPTATPPRRFGAAVWQGQVLSNIITVNVREDAAVSEESKKKVEAQIGKLIDEMPSVHTKGPGYSTARFYLANMVPYSVPALLGKLDHPNPEIRITALDILGDIADNNMRPEKRTCAFWKALISAYEKESEKAVKKCYLATVARCWDLPPDQRAAIAGFLREQMKQSQDEDLRLAAALGYMWLDTPEALGTIMRDGLLDNGTLGEKSAAFLIQFVLIRADPSAMWMNSAADLKAWWQKDETRAGLQAQKAQRDARRRYDQNQK